MKLTEHIYKTSGVETGCNSNTYVIDCGTFLVMLDAGYKEIQWNQMMASLKRWHLDQKPVRYCFLTHGHYDHAGNVHRLNQLKIPVYCADPDAGKVEQGYPEIEKLFGQPWICGKIEHRLKDGERYVFAESIVLEVMAAPGHSQGSIAFVIQDGQQRALCTGDMFFIKPKPPEDAVELELAYMGGLDFSIHDFSNTLGRMAETHCDLLLPGHYYVYYGDVDALAERAYAMTLQLKKREEMNHD